MVSFKTIKADVCLKKILTHYDIFEHLTERGKSYRGACPFCGSDEDNPFSASLEKNCFNAFCCGKHGNIIDFVAEIESVSIKKAAEMIAQAFTIQTKEKTKTVKKNSESKPNTQKKTEEQAQTNPPLKFILKDIDFTHLGLQKLGITEETAVAFGAGYYSGRGLFKEHIVLPIYSYTRKLIAYTGVTPDEPTTPVYPQQFTKEIELFGKPRICDRDLSHRPLIICRHPLEVLLLYQAGFEAVALMSDSINKEQLKLLSRDCGESNKLTLFFAQDDHHTVDIVAELLTLFYIRLVRYDPQPDTPFGFKPEEINDLLDL